MVLAVLTLSILLSTTIIIASLKNAIPVDHNLKPIKDREKNTEKKGIAKSIVFGNRPKSIA